MTRKIYSETQKEKARQKGKSLCVFSLQLNCLLNHLIDKNLSNVYYMPGTDCLRHCGESTNQRDKQPCSDGAYNVREEECKWHTK